MILKYTPNWPATVLLCIFRFIWPMQSLLPRPSSWLDPEQEVIGRETSLGRPHQYFLENEIIVDGDNDRAYGNGERRLEKMSSQYVQMFDKGHLGNCPILTFSLK